MKNEDSNNTIQRRKRILEILAEKGELYIPELSKMFEVSEVTVRNDLKSLEVKNLLLRARGGAIRFEQFVGMDPGLSEKTKLHFIEKVRIGKKAASLIHESDTIIVDSGTTTAEVVKNLPPVKKLTVITNALNIANNLIGKPNINLIIPGGYLRQNSHSLIGPLAEKNLKNFYVDKVFIGVDGFDVHTGIYTPNVEEAHLNQIMIEIAREVILVTDSSKFLRKSLAFICPVNRIDVVVTDDGISRENKKALEDSGVKVLIA
jgi:DeoR family transcriptional regulator of aga operon